MISILWNRKPTKRTRIKDSWTGPVLVCRPLLFRLHSSGPFIGFRTLLKRVIKVLLGLLIRLQTERKALLELKGRSAAQVAFWTVRGMKGN